MQCGCWKYLYAGFEFSVCLSIYLYLSRKHKNTMNAVSTYGGQDGETAAINA